jgi:hypothetical protein
MPYLIGRLRIYNSGPTSFRGHGADLTGYRDDYGRFTDSDVVGGVGVRCAGVLIATRGWPRGQCNFMCNG